MTESDIAVCCHVCRWASWSKKLQPKVIWREWRWSWEGRTPALCLLTVTVSEHPLWLFPLYWIMTGNIVMLDCDCFRMQIWPHEITYWITLFRNPHFSQCVTKRLCVFPVMSQTHCQKLLLLSGWMQGCREPGLASATLLLTILVEQTVSGQTGDTATTVPFMCNVLIECHLTEDPNVTSFKQYLLKASKQQLLSLQTTPNKHFFVYHTYRTIWPWLSYSDIDN